MFVQPSPEPWVSAGSPGSGWGLRVSAAYMAMPCAHTCGPASHVSYTLAGSPCKGLGLPPVRASWRPATRGLAQHRTRSGWKAAQTLSPASPSCTQGCQPDLKAQGICRDCSGKNTPVFRDLGEFRCEAACQASKPHKNSRQFPGRLGGVLALRKPTCFNLCRLPGTPEGHGFGLGRGQPPGHGAELQPGVLQGP